MQPLKDTETAQNNICHHIVGQFSSEPMCGCITECWGRLKKLATVSGLWIRITKYSFKTKCAMNPRYFWQQSIKFQINYGLSSIHYNLCTLHCACYLHWLHSANFLKHPSADLRLSYVISLSKDSCSYRETMIPLLKAKASNRVMSQHMNIILLIVHFCFIVLEHLILHLCWLYFHKNMKWHFQLRFGQNFQQPLKWSEIHFCYFVLLSYYLVKGHLLLSIFFNPQHSVIWSQTEPWTTVYKTMSCNMMTCDILSSFYIFLWPHYS